MVTSLLTRHLTRLLSLISLILQQFTLTRALQGIFLNGQMCFWWMSIICFYDNSRTLAERKTIWQ